MSQHDKLSTIIREALALPQGSDLAGIAYGETPEWDSVGHLQLVSAIEEGYGVSLDANDVVEMTDLASLQHVLATKYAIDAGSHG